MEFPMIDETQNYISFCQKAGLPINEVPEKGKPMGMTYEIAMREIDPYLYERLTEQGKLKADVLDRHQRQAYWTDDVKELEAKGYTGVAANLRKQIEEGRRINEENKLKEMIARNEARDKANRERPVGFQALPPLSPEAIARARQQWGITGEPTY
jgi:hypothetical protein